MMKVAFHTLGCKVNSYESQAMLKHFRDAGYTEVDFKEKADVYVVNTCTVTNTGDSKSRQMIRKAIRTNGDAVVCVVGCYSQIAPDDITNIEGVGVVLGTQFRNDIVSLVEQHVASGKVICKVNDLKNVKKFEDLNINHFSNTRAYIKIQDGCNNFCTYCIIPYARGRVRSRTPNSVINQVKTFVANGYKEVVLTGIHTAGYGEDFDDYCFYDLLKDLVAIEGLARLRISSIEFSQVSDDIINLIQTSNVVVDHLHVPLQAGSDDILLKMNRKYTTSEYLDKINKIKLSIPGIAFTTDVIVGFPGETDENFDQCVEFIEKVDFLSLHVFPYSPRENTPAATFTNQVDGNVKNKRVAILMELSEKLLKKHSIDMIGKTVSVLFEKKKDNKYIGHSSNYVMVEVDSDIDLLGCIKNVKILKYNDKLVGELVDEIIK